jgi:secondary thiamine-phosphate synthase enzyme
MPSAGRTAPRRRSSTSRTRLPASRSTTDLENAFNRVVGDDWEWKHEDADGPNAPSHARASLASSPQVLIPLRDGSLALGTYQGVFFCEFDGPRERKVYVATLS